MNDLSPTAVPRRSCSPVPPPVPRVLLPLFLASLAVAVLILVVVRNALLLGCVLFTGVLVLAFVFWNVLSFGRNGAVLLFVDKFPDSDLRSAADGQLVKITGLASCGDISLESSYERVGRCVYTSTLLYEYGRCGPKSENADKQCFRWNLTYFEDGGIEVWLVACSDHSLSGSLEIIVNPNIFFGSKKKKYATDFYITDMKSGTRALVKAGYNSKIIPLIEETILVNSTSKNRELSSTLKKWLEERHLSSDTRPLRLEEGYIEEGSSLTVMGILSRHNGVPVIVPPAEPFSTGCFLQKFLLPVDIDGLVVRFFGRPTSSDNYIS